MILRSSILAVLLAISAAVRAAVELPLPLEVACGVAAEGPAGASPAPGGARLLPDLPFDPSRGYGYLAGEAGRLSGTAALGGGAGWPVAFREAPRKYSFHLPNGEYLVRLWFLETDVAEQGLRVFDVLAEESIVLAGLDIAGEAGDFRWLSRECLVHVRDGWLDLGFLPRADSRPPRVSRIRIERAEPAAAAPEAPSGLRAEPGPRQVALTWDRPLGGALAGYGVFRSELRDGPFESLTARPVMVERFIDRRVPEGPGVYYRVRAYGVRGVQSPLTPAVEARAGSAPKGLKVFELSIPDDALRRLHARAAAPVPVRGTLVAGGVSYSVEVACLAEGARWQAKKSYSIRITSSTKRALLGRRELMLLAEAGDPALLREKIAQAADGLAGLPAPEVEHVHLELNGAYQGVYVDLEPWGPEFRKRAALDPFGTLVEAPGRLRLDGAIGGLYGRTRGQSGDQGGLTRLVEELSRLDEEDLDGFFEDRFYLDRLIDRLAMAAVRGVDPRREGAEPARQFLEDSRNSKFILFDADHRGGDFGIADFEAPGKDPPGGRSLLGFAVDRSALEGPDEKRWRVLETRFFSRPALRERYLARVGEILEKVLTPERLEAVIAAARAPLAGALFPAGEAAGGPPVDLQLWPGDGGAAFRAAPAAIAAGFRAHRAALLEAVRTERARVPGGLVLSELLLLPKTSGEGAPWIEIHNRSASALDPGGYFLTTDLDQPRSFRLPAGPPIEPGGRRVVVFGPEGAVPTGAGSAAGRPASIDCPLRPSSDGGELGLFREGPGGRPVLADLLFYGRRTAGIACARIPDGGDAWASVASPTPGAPNAGAPLAPPPWKFRTGLEAQKAGGIRLWLQVTGAIDSAAAHLREEGQPAFEVQPLTYDKETFRHQLTLGPERLGRRLEYFFTARSTDGVERAYPLPGPRALLQVPARSALVINEILPRPQRGGAFEEFIELFNAGPEPVSADGMFLTNSKKNAVKFRISHPQPIPPRGFLLIHADGRGEGDHANFHLHNAGGYVGLFTGAGEGNLLVDQMVYPAIPVGQSYGREQDGAATFKVWKVPTPAARNVPKVPPLAPAPAPATAGAAAAGSPAAPTPKPGKPGKLHKGEKAEQAKKAEKTEKAEMHEDEGDEDGEDSGEDMPGRP